MRAVSRAASSHLYDNVYCLPVTLQLQLLKAIRSCVHPDEHVITQENKWAIGTRRQNILGYLRFRSAIAACVDSFFAHVCIYLHRPSSSPNPGAKCLLPAAAVLNVKSLQLRSRFRFQESVNQGLLCLSEVLHGYEHVYAHCHVAVAHS